MMTGLYNTLGYNFDDPNDNIKTLSDNTLTHLNSMPEMIKAWQATDILNNDVGGYFENPVLSATTSIRDTVNLIMATCLTANGVQGSTSTITTLFHNIAINTLPTTCSNYIDHTNRLSGVTPYGENQALSATKPYYQTATATGRLMMYLTHQTDNITDSSPVMGNFTSLFVEPQLVTKYNTLLTYYNQIVNSITYSLDINSYSVATSDLTLSQVSAIDAEISSTITFLTTRQTHDETFFTNSRNLISKYQSTNQFSQTGETQNYLINNFIGSSKLLSRINT